MKITKPQIKQLYKFVQKHYVDWYDVQTELVDHLANGIESLWEKDSNLTFDDALKTEFKKFGVMGFSEVVENKQKALDKRYIKMAWEEFKNHLKLPKIIITLCSIWLLFQLIHSVENKNIIIIPIALILFIIPVSYFYKNAKRIKKQHKLTGKKWLFENTLLQLGGIVHILNIGIYLPYFFNEKMIWSFKAEVSTALLIVIFALVLYVLIYIVPSKLKQKLHKEHPEYNFT